MQSPPDEFVCVPFHSAMMVATGLFIGSRKEQHQTKRLPASWGLCVGVLEESMRNASVLFVSPDQRGQISEQRLHYLALNARYCRLSEPWEEADYRTIPILQW